VSNALKNQGYAYSRVNVDVAGYKQQRASRLEQTAAGWMQQVKDSGKAMDLEPMNAADRRVVHKAAEGLGIRSRSVGEGRTRHIVLELGEAASGDQSDASE